MWNNFIDDLSTTAYQIGSHIVTWLGQHLATIVAILLGAYVVRHFGSKLIMQLMQRTVRADLFPTKTDRIKRIKTIHGLIDASLKIVSWTLAVLLIADNLNIKTTSILASAGFLGIAIGFGAQSLIKDFVSGLFIITENQYRVGDVVELNGISGTVETITTRITVLRDDDGYIHNIPNGTISVSTNKSMDYSRANFSLIVALDTDIDKLEHVINHTGQELAGDAKYQNSIKEPIRYNRIKNLTSAGVEISIIGKTTPSKQWAVRGEFYRKLLKNLKDNDIKLA